MSWLDFFFPLIGEADIRVLSNGTTISVSFLVRTFRLAKSNGYTEVNVPGLNGEPLQFTRGRPHALSVVLVFGGRATNTYVRQPMGALRS